MPIYHYLVVHVPTGKQGRGESVAQALEQALGHKEHQKFQATSPRSGFFWGKYETRTLGITLGSRRTVTPLNSIYEVCPVYMNNPQGTAKDRSLLMAVYRSVNPSMLDNLPENGSTRTPTIVSPKPELKGKGKKPRA